MLFKPALLVLLVLATCAAAVLAGAQQGQNIEPAMQQQQVADVAAMRVASPSAPIVLPLNSRATLGSIPVVYSPAVTSAAPPSIAIAPLHPVTAEAAAVAYANVSAAAGLAVALRRTKRAAARRLTVAPSKRVYVLAGANSGLCDVMNAFYSTFKSCTLSSDCQTLSCKDSTSFGPLGTLTVTFGLN